MAITEEQVMQALMSVVDPELRLSIVDLGLIYGVTINPTPEGEHIKLRMTLTTPFCPYGPSLKTAAEQAASKLPGVVKAEADMVFNPPWDPRTMASEEAKIALGLGWDESPSDTDTKEGP
jgi:metal-sulfur cluster biosynthetic enzyme